MSNQFFQPTTKPEVASNATQQADPERKAKLCVVPKDFPSTIGSSVMSIVDLCEEVNNLMIGVCSDYYGCNIYPYPSQSQMAGQLACDFFFKEIPNNPNPGAAFIQPTQVKVTEKSSPLQRMQAFNKANTRCNSYELTKVGKDILGQLCYPTDNRGNVNFQNYTFEAVDNTNYSQVVTVKIVAIDINKVLEKIYGDSDAKLVVENGKAVEKVKKTTNYYYNIVLIRPEAAPQGMMTANYLINILRLDDRELQKLLTKAGIVPTTSSIQMVRATR